MGVIFAIGGILSGELPLYAALMSALSLSLVPPTMAGLGILLDGFARHQGKFGEIEHSPWIWHIYPIISWLQISFVLICIPFGLANKSKS